MRCGAVLWRFVLHHVGYRYATSSASCTDVSCSPAIRPPCLQVESFAAVLQHLAPAPAAGRDGAPAAQRPCEHQPANSPTGRREQLQEHYERTAPAGRPPSGQAPRQLHVVDFGCGTGSLLLPLAAAFPHCHFTGSPPHPWTSILAQPAPRLDRLAASAAAYMWARAGSAPLPYRGW